VNELERIVRALAERDEPVTEGHNGNDFCVFCVLPKRPYHYFSGQPEAHENDCPWRLAKEWVAAHQETETRQQAHFHLAPHGEPCYCPHPDWSIPFGQACRTGRHLAHSAECKCGPPL
jgi:hypothetical protein